MMGAFTLGSSDGTPYFIDVELKPDTTLMARLMRYVVDCARDALADVEGPHEVSVPATGILFVGAGDAMPDELQVSIGLGGKRTTMGVPVLKVQDYTLERIFRKRLFALLPVRPSHTPRGLRAR